MSGPGSSEGHSVEAEEQYLAFAKRVIQDATQWAEAEGLARGQQERVVFIDSGIATQESEVTLFWPLLKNHYGDELWGTIEAERCTRTHLTHGFIQPPQMSRSDGTRIVEPTFEQMRPYVVVELLKPLVAAFERHDMLQLADEQILATYHAAVANWTASEFEHQLLIPISGLTSDVDFCQVGQDLQFSPFTNDEKSKAWWFGVFPFQAPNVWELQGCAYKLIAQKTLPRGERLDQQSIDRDVRMFVLAMRLFKAGNVGTLGSFGGTPNDVARSYGQPSSELRIPQGNPNYRLSESELPTVLSLFGTLKQGFLAGQLKSLDTAFRRFNLSYSRGMDEDRLIDLTIALESSVLFDQQQELRYRLAMRGAKLLAHETPPVQTKALLEVMYDTRSGIVHRGQTISGRLRDRSFRDLSPAPSSSSEFADQCAAVVRRILKAYVGLLTSRNQSLRDANSQLDQEIVAALTPPTEIG